MSSEVGSRIAKNSIFNFVRTFLTIPITLLLTPYIIWHLGKEEFGIWALVGVVSSYAQLSDFGITESLIKFMAEYKSGDDKERLNRLVNTAFTVYLILSVIFCVIFIIVMPFVVNKILTIPHLLQGKATYVFTIAIMLFFTNMLMGVFGSLIIGFQRMGYSNLISLLSTVITACGTFLFLHNGYGLTGLIYNNAVVTVFVVISNCYGAKRLFPELRVNPFRYFSKEILGKIFGFSWKVQVTNITQLMIFQVDRVLLSHYLGLEAVSYYEIANKIASHAKGFVISIFSPMVPAASALQAADEKEKITGLYRRSFKYMAMADIPFSLLIIALAHPFVRTWMGPGYEMSAFTLQLLMVSYMLNLLTAPGAFILSGTNKPQISMRSSVIAGITNLALCFFLVQWIGYYGILIGIFTSIATSGVYFIWMVQKNIHGLCWLIYPETLLRPFVVSISLATALLFLDKILPLRGYLALCSLGMIYMAFVGVALFKGKYLDGFDRETLSKLNPLRMMKL